MSFWVELFPDCVHKGNFVPGPGSCPFSSLKRSLPLFILKTELCCIGNLAIKIETALEIHLFVAV